MNEIIRNARRRDFDEWPVAPSADAQRLSCRANIIGTTAALIGGALIGTGGSIASSAMASSAAGKAASTQAQAAVYAADLQKKAADASLIEAGRQYDINQLNLQPWLQSGQSGLNALTAGLGLQPTTSSTAAPATNALLPGQAAQLSILNADRSELQQRLDEASKKLEAANKTGGWTRIVVGATTRKLVNDLEKQIQGIDSKINAIQPQVQAQPQSQTQNQLAVDATGQTAATLTPTPTAGDATGVPGLTFGQLLAQFDPSTVALDPGADFRQTEALKSIQRSAAAQGSGLGGGTLKAITDYSQNLASNEYDRAYNRQFNTFQVGQANVWNRLASLAGIGQTAATQLGSAGQSYANTVGNINMGAAASMGDYATQAANARASGIVGSANSWANGLSNIGNNIANLYSMNATKAPTNYLAAPAATISPSAGIANVPAWQPNKIVWQG